MRPTRRLAVAAVAVAVLTSCGQGGNPGGVSGGEEQSGPDTDLEAPAPNQGREDLDNPDAGET